MITRSATIVSTVSILIASWWLYAQAPAPVLVSVQTSGAGPTTLAANNTAPKTVTAFLVAGDLSAVASAVKSGAVRVSASAIYDAATEPLAAKPLPPNQVSVLPYLLPPAGKVGALSVSAVLFADGTSWGDAASVTRLLNRRAYMQKHLAVAVADLVAAAGESGAISDAALRSQTIQQFQSAMAGELAASAGADESACVRSVRSVTIANLRRVVLRNNGSAITTEEVISRELAVLSSRLSKVKAGGM